MKTQNSILTFLALICFLATSAQKRVDKTFSGIDQIEMNIGAGNVEFSKGSSTDVRVQLEHDFDDYEPIFEQKGSRLVIREERNKRNSYSGNAIWQISIPEGISVSHNTGAGNVEISDLKVDLDMNSGSGDYEIENVEGDLRFNTGSGSIDATNITGEIWMNTGSGDIDISDSKVRIFANTGSGSIQADGIELTGSANFNTGSGDSEVSLSKSPGYDLIVNTGSGDASLDFGGNSIEGTLMVTINKKRGKIKAPFEFDTTEEIDQGYNTQLRKTKRFTSSNVDIQLSTGSGVASVRE